VVTGSTPFPPDCARRYQPREVLAQGAFGTVYRATQNNLHRDVAIKLLQPEALENEDAIRRFMAEARITVSLSHPHIVVLLDHGCEAGIPWIAYEYIRGDNLRQILRNGPLPVREALIAVWQVTQALQEAHGRKILHRDIKPENVLRVQPEDYKVADFGIARWLMDRSFATATGQVVGTPAYMAPEVLQGEPPGMSCDLYATGVLLYELLTGRVPFPQDNLVLLLEAQLAGGVPSVAAQRSGVKRPVDNLIRRALAADPRDRFPTAAAMAAALEAIVQPAGQTALLVELPPSRSGTRTAARPDRRRTAGVIITICTVFSIAIAARTGKDATDVPVSAARDAAHLALFIKMRQELAARAGQFSGRVWDVYRNLGSADQDPKPRLDTIEGLHDNQQELLETVRATRRKLADRSGVPSQAPLPDLALVARFQALEFILWLNQERLSGMRRLVQEIVDAKGPSPALLETDRLHQLTAFGAEGQKQFREYLDVATQLAARGAPPLPLLWDCTLLLRALDHPGLESPRLPTEKLRAQIKSLPASDPRLKDGRIPFDGP
jgi:tRNA A-37 threonylcarbamoyl transferase component Bud32